MKKYLILLAVSLLLSSCATVFSRKEYDMRVTSNIKNASVKVYDKDYKLPASIKVKRSKEDLQLVFNTDSLQKQLTLKSRISPRYIVGNLFFYPPISYFVDLNNDKRFYYKKNIYIKVKDTSARFGSIPLGEKLSSIFKPSLIDETGTVKLHVSIPWMNEFNFAPNGEKRVSNFGFLGVATGIDYFYKKDRFLSFQTDAKTSFDFLIPVPILFDSGERIVTSSVNFALSNNKKLNKFSYGYGLNYAQNYWLYINEYYDEATSTNVAIRKKSKNENLGLHLNSYFQLSDSFYIGIVYQPSFINFNTGPKFQYEHSLSLDLAWKINLFKIK